jgi:hypothetical protein
MHPCRKTYLRYGRPSNWEPTNKIFYRHVAYFTAASNGAALSISASSVSGDAAQLKNMSKR